MNDKELIFRIYNSYDEHKYTYGDFLSWVETNMKPGSTPEGHYVLGEIYTFDKVMLLTKLFEDVKNNTQLIDDVLEDGDWDVLEDGDLYSWCSIVDKSGWSINDHENEYDYVDDHYLQFKRESCYRRLWSELVKVRGILTNEEEEQQSKVVKFIFKKTNELMKHNLTKTRRTQMLLKSLKRKGYCLIRTERVVYEIISTK